MVRVRIDKDACIGCGACWALAPNFFEQNENDGKSQIVEQYRVGGDATVGEPPADMVDDVKSAAEGCPVGAIKIEE
ncbi:MAG: ferredoxin [Thaumarchaeota archaeon]|nr:ferredoxin [Nitrososphaerota archaeon]HDD40636.1 ferredoxin [Nitrososphaeria archaeon]